MKESMSKGSICFVGDLIFGDQPATFGYGIYSSWNPLGYTGIFDNVGETLRTANVVVGNFECTINDGIPNADYAVTKHMMSCGSDVCTELYRNNIRVVSVANNHTFDYGHEGYQRTVDALRKHNITVIGDAQKPYAILSGGGNSRLAVVGCSYIKVKNFENAPYWVNPEKEAWNKIVDEIAKTVDRIIAYVHWGNEFVRLPTKEQKRISEELIAIGVDDVIGCHSHILQTRVSNGSHNTFFSLGNFVSDYWQKRLRKTVIISLNTDTFEYSEIPCYINRKMMPTLSKGTTRYLARSEQLASNKDIAINRMVSRFEYLIKIILNYRKLRGKRVLFHWVLGRMGYFARNYRREIEDPNSIYYEFEVKSGKESS